MGVIVAGQFAATPGHPRVLVRVSKRIPLGLVFEAKELHVVPFRQREHLSDSEAQLSGLKQVDMSLS